MDEITFIVDPNLIAIAVAVIPVLVELLTRAGVKTKLKQQVATGVVVAAVIGSLAIDLWVEHTIKVDDTNDVLRLILLVISQLGVVRVAVEGGHRLYDSVETEDRNLEKVLLPNRGFH